MTTNEQEGKDVLDIQAQLKAELEAAKSAVAPPSGFVISTKGKQFTLPDGSVSAGPMVAIILDWVTMNMYYSGAYNPSKPADPECWALGRDLATLGPSEGVPKKQGEDCGSCAKNEWGSATGGGKGKACKNTRRLLVIGPEGLTKDSQPYTLTVSPTGLKHFDKYVSSLTARGTHPMEMLTEISFDPSEAFPSLRFKPVEKHNHLDLVFGLKTVGENILTTEPQIERAA
jgi:hypothetical protein